MYPLLDKPLPPQNLRAGDVGRDFITLHWDAATDDAKTPVTGIE